MIDVKIYVPRCSSGANIIRAPREHWRRAKIFTEDNVHIIAVIYVHYYISRKRVIHCSNCSRSELIKSSCSVTFRRLCEGDVLASSSSFDSFVIIGSKFLSIFLTSLRRRSSLIYAICCLSVVSSICQSKLFVIGILPPFAMPNRPGITELLPDYQVIPTSAHILAFHQANKHNHRRQ